MKTVGVLQFPGTNCDRDVFEAVEKMGLKAQWLWHQDQFLPMAFDSLILPGGFSYGDYLRSGALAARSAAMKSVREAAHKGVPILGICNGFQILCEAELLPGALLKNAHGRFRDLWTTLTLKNSHHHFATSVALSQKVKIPVAHGDGRFFAPSDEIKKIWDQGQVWWTYEENPNGSLDDIAGVMNETKNVCALMPHPERAMDAWMGGLDGRSFFEL